MSRSAAIRASAARVVALVAEQGRTLDAALQTQSTETPQERALLRSLSYESIRWYVRLEALLRKLLTRDAARVDPQVRALAIVGLCQLLHMRIPAHAAVDETVNAARLIGHPRAAGLINALLRRCQREHGTLLPQIDADPAVAVAHPRWLFETVRRDWQTQAGELFAANNAHPPFWLRVNRQRISGPEYCALLEAAGMRIAARAWSDTAVQLEEAVDATQLPGFADGLVSIQDAAAQMAAHLLAPAPGERVLDACAAPGGKACHLLEVQPALAELTALDVSGERLRKVRENLQRLQLQANLIEGDAAQPAAWWDGTPYQHILLDAPCSASGVIRRHPDIKLLRRHDDLPALAERQLALLQALWPLLAPGGQLLYATCSVLDIENSQVIGRFLQRTPDASDITEQVFARYALPSQPGIGQRIAPGTAGMDGFYYACLHKMSRETAVGSVRT